MLSHCRALRGVRRLHVAVSQPNPTILDQRLPGNEPLAPARVSYPYAVAIDIEHAQDRPIPADAAALTFSPRAAVEPYPVAGSQRHLVFVAVPVGSPDRYPVAADLPHLAPLLADLDAQIMRIAIRRRRNGKAVVRIMSIGFQPLGYQRRRAFRRLAVTTRHQFDRAVFPLQADGDRRSSRAKQTGDVALPLPLLPEGGQNFRHLPLAQRLAGQFDDRACLDGLTLL